MTTSRLAAVLLLVAGSLCAQSIDTEWAAFTDMGPIQDLVVDGQDIWSATSGGVLHFDGTSQSYQRYTALDGLGGNRVFAVARDQEGFLWFGTDGQGLSRFDPQTARFAPPFLDFRDLRITALLALDDRIYVGTSRGISVFLLDKEEVKESYRRLGGLPKDTEVGALAIHDGILFAATPDGMAWARLDQPNLQDPDSWTSASRTGAASDVAVVDGTVFAATVLGVYTFDAATDAFVRAYDEDAVTALGAYSGGVLAATAGGNFLRRDEAGRWVRIGAPIYPDVSTLSRTGQPYAVVGNGAGLHTVGPGAIDLPTSGEPGSSRFYEVLVDGDELWATSVPDDQQRSLSAGAYRFADGAWTVFRRANGMPNDELVAVEEDDEGRVWVGTWGGSVMLRELDGTWVQVGPDNSPLRPIGSGSFVVVCDVQRDPQGNLWMLNNLIGVVVVDGFPVQQGLRIEQQDHGLTAGIGGTDLYRMDIAANGLKWIASRTDGVILLDDGGTPFDGTDDRMVRVDGNTESRLTSDWVVTVHAADDGRLWIATDNGLHVFTPDYDRATGVLQRENWRSYTTFDGLPSAEINALESDAAGNLWVGTENGLVRIGADGDIDFTLDQSNSGLIDNRVKGLTFDPVAGELWIGTFDGLSRLRVTGTDDGGAPDAAGVFPNPFFVDGSRRLTFAGLPLGAALRVYTLTGDPVASLRADPGRGTVTWDGLNDTGFLVGSGIYLYVAEGDAGARVRGRFAVLGGTP